jgi:hypothetical protein
MIHGNDRFDAEGSTTDGMDEAEIEWLSPESLRRMALSNQVRFLVGRRDGERY